MIGPDEYKGKIECSAPFIRRALVDLDSSHYFSYVKIIITNEYLTFSPTNGKFSSTIGETIQFANNKVSS